MGHWIRALPLDQWPFFVTNERRKDLAMPDTTVALTDLLPDPRNARTHSDRNIALIADALRDVGAGRSIVVDETGTVLAGNATITAAQQAGLSHVRVIEANGTELIAVRRTGLTQEQKQRLALYDNRAAELAAWDTDVLASLADDLDLGALWNGDELAALLGQEDAAGSLTGDPDEIPDTPTEAVTKQGDVWQLGPHRLLCGDATSGADVQRLLAGAHAACLWTDPPYGVSYVGKTAAALTIANDDAGGLEGLLRGAFTAVGASLVPGAAFYIAHPVGPRSLAFAQVIDALGWSVRQSLVWVKDALVLGYADYHYRHEPILFGFLPGPGRRGRGGVGWYGDHAQDTVFEIPRPTASPDHPTSKPVALVTAMLGNSTQRGDLVLDPFGGSGTTLIACEELGRACRMLELDPRYSDVIVRRWESLTGQSATRIAAAIAA
jgi:DNA modification methylase